VFDSKDMPSKYYKVHTVTDIHIFQKIFKCDCRSKV